MVENNSDPGDRGLLELLGTLRAQHQRLDREIETLRETGVVDMLKIGRMEKIKFKLKDRIAVIKDSLAPDIIA